jgi:hypothetical protein
MTISLQDPIIEQKCIWLEFAADKSRTVTNNNKSFKSFKFISIIKEKEFKL